MGEILDRLCAAFLEDCAKKGVLRQMKTVHGPQGRTIEISGREYISFASNNFLGLANHPETVGASKKALEKYGVGTGASRLITGSMTVHKELEEAIARFKERDAALVYPTGYLANVGAIPVLTGEGDVIFSDSSNHSSIIDGIRLSKARRKIYRHLDMEDLEERLKNTPCTGRRLIVTDTLFSMEGDIAPLDEIAVLAEKYGAMTMADEAHATGVLGPRGRGGEEHFSIVGRIDVVMGTLSKALGSQGGFIAGSRALSDTLVNGSRSFIYSTGLAVPAAAAALEAIRLLERDGSILAALRKNIRQMRAAVSDAGLPLPRDETHIFLITIGAEDAAVKAAERFLEKGVIAPAVRYPTLPRGEASLRVVVSAEHTDADIARFGGTLAEVLGKI